MRHLALGALLVGVLWAAYEWWRNPMGHRGGLGEESDEEILNDQCAYCGDNLLLNREWCVQGHRQPDPEPEISGYMEGKLPGALPPQLMNDLRAIDEDGQLVPMPGAKEVSALQRALAEAEEENERLETENRLLFKDNRMLRQRNSELTGKRNSAKELDAYNESIEEVYEHYRKVLAPKASEEVGEKRWAVVRARLNAGFTVEQLKQAIEGAALVPEDFAGRKAMQKLEYICRHPDHVESFIDDYMAAKNPATSETFSTDSVQNVSTSTPHLHIVQEPQPPHTPTIAVPDWPVKCVKGCDHTKMLRGTWGYWQWMGMAGCPWCGYDVETPDGVRSSEYRWEPVSQELFARVEKGDKL